MNVISDSCWSKCMRHSLSSQQCKLYSLARQWQAIMMLCDPTAFQLLPIWHMASLPMRMHFGRCLISLRHAFWCSGNLILTPSCQDALGKHCSTDFVWKQYVSWYRLTQLQFEMFAHWSLLSPWCDTLSPVRQKVNGHLRQGHFNWQIVVCWLKD